MSRLFLSATHKSSGKTTIAAGLCAALSEQGLKVQPFKKGPDYIDPMWLSRAAGNPCINLDFNTMQEAEIRTEFSRYAQSGDLSIIEGNKGLFDGLDVEGSDSNAAMAEVLNAPVLLVLDTKGITRGIAPVLLGYQSFDPDISISGVILNNVSSTRHESKLRAAIERYTDTKIVGSVRFDPALVIVERHLGLTTDKEDTAATRTLKNITNAISSQVDLDAVRSIADCADSFVVSALPLPSVQPADIKIGIARDSAFGFYYADDLSAFARQGGQLIPFDTLNDATLPEVDGLYIGGGFPETHAAALSGNTTMRAAIKRFIDQGKPVYAECGGLMYLAQRLTWADKSYEMVGAIPAHVEMTERPVGRGYVVLAETGNGLWAMCDTAGCEYAGYDTTRSKRDIPAHEFHYSKLSGLADNIKFAYQVKRGYGIDGKFDGLVYANVQANYSHFRNTVSNPWVKQFVGFVRAHKSREQQQVKQATGQSVAAKKI